MNLETRLERTGVGPGVGANGAGAAGAGETGEPGTDHSLDFSLTDEQRGLVALVERILADHVTPERLAAQEVGGEWLDREVWRDLARAGVLGMPLPEEVGGGGAGFLELHLVLEVLGRHVAHLPVWPTLVLGALPVARFGTRRQRDQLLRPVVAGESLLTAALTGEPVPEATAHPDGDGWRLDGLLGCVPVAQLASRILVPAAVAGPGVHVDRGGGDAPGGGEVVVLLLDPHAAGVEVRPQQTVDGQPQAQVELTGVRIGAGDVLAGPDRGRAALTWMLERAWTGIASLQAGLCAKVLRMSADYTSGREQFGRPVASFQAVGQRLADAYIDTEAVRLTALQAAWRLSEGLPAAEEAAIAKWWAAEGGHRVLHAAQHVHGGVGVDLEYPLHRYFLAGKQLEFTLGSATHHLLRLGARLAAQLPGDGCDVPDAGGKPEADQ
jgi:3-oxocholest-4-en-26-oyl-CoA dehydrogenase beta subunit